MKDALINAGISFLTKNNDFNNHTKSIYYDEVNECLNNLEVMVCGIISDTWCFFDERANSKKEVEKKFNDVNKKFNDFIAYRDKHKTKISKKMLKILNEIEIELAKEKQSVQSLFFIKSDIIEDLENNFVEQLKIDRKKIEKGKKL